MAATDSSGSPPLPDGVAPDPAGPFGQEPQWTWLARIRRPQGRKGEVFADILTDYPEKFAERRRLWLVPENPASLSDTPSKPAEGMLSSAKHAGSTAENLHSSKNQKGLVSGHDFSRAEDAKKQTRALAPGGQCAASSPSAAPREVTLENHWLHKGGIVLHFAGVDSISAAETLAGLIVAIPRAERAVLGEDEAYIGDLIGCTLVDVSSTSAVAVGEIEGVDRTAGPVPLLILRGAHGEVLVPFAKSFLRKIDLEAKRVKMALPEGLVDLNAPDKP